MHSDEKASHTHAHMTCRRHVFAEPTARSMPRSRGPSPSMARSCMCTSRSLSIACLPPLPLARPAPLRCPAAGSVCRQTTTRRLRRVWSTPAADPSSSPSCAMDLIDRPGAGQWTPYVISSGWRRRSPVARYQGTTRGSPSVFQA